MLENRYYDFKVDNFLIEINPTATHNATWSPWCKDCGLDKYYHADKTDLATKIIIDAYISGTGIANKR